LDDPKNALTISSNEVSNRKKSGLGEEMLWKHWQRRAEEMRIGQRYDVRNWMVNEYLQEASFNRQRMEAVNVV
jgi:hypothetical protein